VFHSAVATPEEGMISILTLGALLWLAVGVVWIVQRRAFASQPSNPTH